MDQVEATWDGLGQAYRIANRPQDLMQDRGIEEKEFRIATYGACHLAEHFEQPHKILGNASQGVP